MVGITEVWVQIPVPSSSFRQVNKFLWVSASSSENKDRRTSLLGSLWNMYTSHSRRHMDSSVVSTEETVAGDKDSGLQSFKKKKKNRTWVYILEVNLLAVCSLASHLTLFNFNFLTCKMRMLSTPGYFQRRLTEEALYSRVAMKTKHSMSEHM